MDGESRSEFRAEAAQRQRTMWESPNTYEDEYGTTVREGCHFLSRDAVLTAFATLALALGTQHYLIHHGRGSAAGRHVQSLIIQLAATPMIQAALKLFTVSDYISKKIILAAQGGPEEQQWLWRTLAKLKERDFEEQEDLKPTCKTQCVKLVINLPNILLWAGITYGLYKGLEYTINDLTSDCIDQHREQALNLTGTACSQVWCSSSVKNEKAQYTTNASIAQVRRGAVLLAPNVARYN